MAEPVPYDEHERAVLEEIDERDRAIEWADKLAAALAPPSVVGEHSSSNNPWANALKWAEEHPRPRLTVNEEVLLQRRRAERQKRADCDHVYDRSHWAGILGYRYYCQCGDSSDTRSPDAA